MALIRLLQCKSDGEIVFREPSSGDVPSYALLSRTWGKRGGHISGHGSRCGHEQDREQGWVEEDTVLREAGCSRWTVNDRYYTKRRR